MPLARLWFIVGSEPDRAPVTMPLPGKSRTETGPAPVDNTYARVWALAWPLILSNLTVPLVGAADTAVVGHLDDPAFIGGVALGTLVFNYVYWGFGFLRMGTTGLVSQAVGAGDSDEARALLARALVLAAVFGGAVALGRGPIGDLAIAWLGGSAAVQGHAADYFAIRALAAPLALANQGLLGWFLGMQNARYGLVQQVVVNGVNVLMDVVLVFGWGMDVEGVAWAAVIGQGLGLLVGLALARRLLARAGGGFERRRILDLGRLRAMMVVNRDIFIRTVCLLTGSAVFMSWSAGLGDIILAANAVLMIFQMIAAFGLDGFAHATEAMVGRAVGARDRRQLDAVVRAGTVCAAGVGLGVTGLYLLGSGLLIDGLTGIETVRVTAETFAVWAIVLPVASVWAFQLDGIFIGSTRTAEMRNAMVASLAVFLMAGWPFSMAFGNHGLWAAYTLFMAARAVTLFAYYPRVRAQAETSPS